MEIEKEMRSGRCDYNVFCCLTLEFKLKPLVHIGQVIVEALNIEL